MADTARTRPGTAGGITSPDYWEARWAKALADAKAEDDKALLVHTESEWHSGRFRFVTIGCDFGVPGTALTQTGIWGHRVIEFPLETNTWKLTASPTAGSAVVDVLKAADLAAFASGTYTSVCTGSLPTLSGQRAAEGAALGVWPVVGWLPGEVLVWQLVSVSGGIDVLGAQIGCRRT